MIGQALREWRGRKKLSQRALAKLLGCSQAYVGALETGAKRRPGTAIAFAIERVTGGALRARDWTEARRSA